MYFVKLFILIILFYIVLSYLLIKGVRNRMGTNTKLALSIDNEVERYEFLQKCKSGDIFLTGYNAPLIKTFSDSHWTHTSIVVRPEGDLETEYVKPDIWTHGKSKTGIYFLEVGVYGDSKYSNVALIPVEDWFRMNSKYDHAWVPVNKDISTVSLYHQYFKYKNYPYNVKIPKLLNTLRLTTYTPNVRYNEFFCSQFASHVYQELGYIPKTLSPDSFSPGDYFTQKFTYFDELFNDPILVF